MSLFHNATYVASAHRLSDLPAPGEWEVAFAGRSNAGKSSAINALVHHARLAFVSKTPGRTQQINLFRIVSGGLLVDLPGYGYAKVPHELRTHWETTLGTYLQSRPTLRGLVLVMDARHPLTERDRVMLAWFRPTRRPVHVLLTKADKLTRSEATLTLRQVRAKLGSLGSNYSAQLFSALNRSGVEEAERVVAGWLGMEVPPEPVPPPRQAAEARNKKAPGQRGKPGAKGLNVD